MVGLGPAHMCARLLRPQKACPASLTPLFLLGWRGFFIWASVRGNVVTLSGFLAVSGGTLISRVDPLLIRDAEAILDEQQWTPA
jgi:hypothetical protein